MKPLLFALIPFASSACFGHDGSGKIVSEHRPAALFDRVDISGAMDVFISIDDEPTVVVDTDDNLQKKVITEVKNGTLHVYTKDSIDPTKLLVHITTPKLVGFDGSGATNVVIEGIDSDRFELDLSGASEISLSGEADVFVIDASGAVEINAAKLISERVEIDASGAAEIDVYASETLLADVSGAGEVNYAGEPKDVKTDLSGAASVERK